MTGTRIGYALTQVLEGAIDVENSVSPTDIAMDIHDASVALEDFLEKWTHSSDLKCKNVANALLPIFRTLSETTEDKYKLARGG